MQLIQHLSTVAISVRYQKQVQKPFKSCSLVVVIYKFDPSDDCVVSDQKCKKKSTSVRIKPLIFPVVLLRKTTAFVPKGHSRQLLNKHGCIEKILFRRNMSEDEVTSGSSH